MSRALSLRLGKLERRSGSSDLRGLSDDELEARIGAKVEELIAG